MTLSHTNKKVSNAETKSMSWRHHAVLRDPTHSIIPLDSQLWSGHQWKQCLAEAIGTICSFVTSLFRTYFSRDISQIQKSLFLEGKQEVRSKNLINGFHEQKEKLCITKVVLNFQNSLNWTTKKNLFYCLHFLMPKRYLGLENACINPS